ncbi:MAG: phospholipid-binding protein MlaC [Elusimicrobiales bacterium]
MYKKKVTLIILLTLLGSGQGRSAHAQIAQDTTIAQATAPAANFGAATRTVQDLVSSARLYSDVQAPGITAEEKQSRAAVEEKLSTVLDLHEMARLILARNWEKQKPADRERYATLLTALVEKIGYPQIEKFFNGRIELSYIGERPVEAGKASVFTAIVYKDEDQKLSTEFRLYQTEKGWRIYDVITDGESLLLIYRNQHSGIIKEKGFPHLIKLMEKKLNEAK